MPKLKVASKEALKKTKKMRVEVENEPVLLVYFNDLVYAISDKCPHLKASLYKGAVDGNIVICAKHNAQIDVTNGEVLEKAKVLFLKMPTKKAKTFKVTLEGDDIYLEV